MIEENWVSVKGSIKSKKKKNPGQKNIQKIWDTVEQPNLKIIDIEEAEETQVKGTKIFLTKLKKKISKV